MIVVLGLMRGGDKRPLGLWQDLLRRGLEITERVLCVIDGGKGLRNAAQDVLVTAAVIQRCQIRNMQALLPKTRQAHVRAAMRRADWAPSGDAAPAPTQAPRELAREERPRGRGSKSAGGPRGNAEC